MICFQKETHQTRSNKPDRARSDELLGDPLTYCTNSCHSMQQKNVQWHAMASRHCQFNCVDFRSFNSNSKSTALHPIQFSNSTATQYEWLCNETMPIFPRGLSRLSYHNYFALRVCLLLPENL